MDDLREKVMNALGRCESYGYCEDKQCPYYECTGCLDLLRKDALSLLKTQDTTMLQGFLTDIPSSESILNSVNCHAISLEHASQIIAICACACDLISPSGFISWLKERIAQDAILKGVLGNDKSRNH